MKFLFLVLMAVLSPLLSSGQGVVNVNNRGLAIPQLVMTPEQPWFGSPVVPLVGTQWVAQIVYGPSNLPLGDPMPFRVPTTSSPGTWNPGVQGIRTLQGFNVGANVTMQVRVWDSSLFANWAEAQAALASGFPPNGSNGAFAGLSAPFTYTVGTSDNPASLALQNFRGFTLTAAPCLCPPPCNVEVSLFLTVENTGSPLELNLWTNLVARADPGATSVGPLTATSPVGALIVDNPNPQDPVTNRLGVLSGTLERAVLTWNGDVVGGWSGPINRELRRPYRPFSYDPATGTYIETQCGWTPGAFQLVAIPPGGRPTFGIRRLNPSQYELRVRGRSFERYKISRSFDLTNFTLINDLRLEFEGELTFTNRYDASPNAPAAFWKLE